MTPEKIKAAASLMKDKSNTVKDICQTLGVSSATLYRYVTPTGQLRIAKPARRYSMTGCEPSQEKIASAPGQPLLQMTCVIALRPDVVIMVLGEINRTFPANLSQLERRLC